MITNKELKKIGFKKLQSITNYKNVWGIKKNNMDVLYLFIENNLSICSDYETILQGEDYIVRNFKNFAWDILDYKQLSKLIKDLKI